MASGLAGVDCEVIEGGRGRGIRGGCAWPPHVNQHGHEDLLLTGQAAPADAADEIRAAGPDSPEGVASGKTRPRDQTSTEGVRLREQPALSPRAAEGCAKRYAHETAGRRGPIPGRLGGPGSG